MVSKKEFYSHSPRLEKDEQGKAKVVKPKKEEVKKEEGEGDNETMQMLHRHSKERMDLNHKHESEILKRSHEKMAKKEETKTKAKGE